MTVNRSNHRKILWQRLAVLIAWSVAVASCTPPASTGAFRNSGVLETQLHRGVSTKADVQALLGVPNGPGSTQIPALGSSVPREIWYYEDIALAGSAMRMQMILVFFNGNTFDGYLWTTGAGATEIKF
jgi:hypothetical protein